MRLRNIPGAKDAIQESAYVVQDPKTHKGKWTECFSKKQPLHIEAVSYTHLKGYADLWDPSLEDSIALVANYRVINGITNLMLGKSMNEEDVESIKETGEKLLELAPNVRPVSYTHLHKAELGVILDWTPAHFPRYAEGLECFDGTPLYEVQDPEMAVHPMWGTLLYNCLLYTSRCV